jgi:peptide/nickel transport system ATP-binding protein
MAWATETPFDRRLNEKPPVRLSVERLGVTYRTRKGPFRAVDGVSFEVAPGRVLGLVGESGCGKSTVVKALMRLLPESARTEGRILLDGEDLVPMDERALRRVRWTRVALITQSAMNALDPVVRVGDQIVESIRAHEPVDRETAWARARSLFSLVGLPPERLVEYPHQFSGGMRQRAVIAMALSLNAGLLLADEPTTALDPIMQDQIMARIRSIQARLHRSMVLVTHDVGLVAENCDDVAVMYAGQIVEKGPTAKVLVSAHHPYTIGLHHAFPRMPEEGEERPPLISIAGGLPNLLDPPPGCRFAPRCPFATDRCRAEAPRLRPIAPGHEAACHYAEEAEDFRRRAALPETWKREAAA